MKNEKVLIAIPGLIALETTIIRINNRLIPATLFALWMVVGGAVLVTMPAFPMSSCNAL